MSTNKDYNKQLIDRFTKNKASFEELEVFDHLIRSDQIDKDLREHMEESWNTVFEENAVLEKSKKTKWIWSTVAAAILLFVLAGVGYVINRDSRELTSSGIVLTLADGRQIELDSGNESGISELANGKITEDEYGKTLQLYENEGSQTDYQTISVPRGEKIRLILTDGTKVWLNAASSLRYPTSFANEQTRTVFLEGEGYFEVHHTKQYVDTSIISIPFIVSTDRQNVRVLGTKFNISNYPEEHTVKTALLEGAVQVEALRFTGHKQLLKPGQQLTIGSDKLELTDIDVDAESAWTRCELVFENEELEVVMDKLERLYDIDVIYVDDVARLRLGAKISTRKSLQETLQLLSATQLVSFKIEGRRVMVFK